MRISDWSSDVCSSDLGVDGREALLAFGGDQFPELHIRAVLLFGIRLVDKVLGAADRSARTHRRTTQRADGADCLVALDLVDRISRRPVGCPDRPERLRVTDACRATGHVAGTERTKADSPHKLYEN